MKPTYNINYQVVCLLCVCVCVCSNCVTELYLCDMSKTHRWKMSLNMAATIWEIYYNKNKLLYNFNLR